MARYSAKRLHRRKPPERAVPDGPFDATWVPTTRADMDDLWWRQPHFDYYAHLDDPEVRITWHEDGTFTKERLSGDALAEWLAFRERMIEAIQGSAR